MGNHGWGMREMIIYMCIFAIILLFVAFSINALYKRINRDAENAKNNTPVIVEPVEDQQPEPVIEEPPRAVDYTYYQQLEKRVYDATYKYLQEKPTEIGDNILKLDSDTLINLGFMNPLYNDIGSQKCTAYSNVYVDAVTKEYVVRSYVRCDNYTSEGY